MNLYAENTTRKVDSLGRVSIPKSMRDRLQIACEDEMEFYLLDYKGERYVCMTNHKGTTPDRYKIAVAVLEELNIEIPEALVDAYNEADV